MALGPQRRIEQGVAGQQRQARAGDVALACRFAQQHAGVHQPRQDAQHRGLGQAGGVGSARAAPRRTRLSSFNI
ncbi:hypothetical protein CNMCM8686_008837 [Aspergillus fumigatus]|nr:hypothetical protein CNMCM8686_008837 [Aspergillus fumigatus]